MKLNPTSMPVNKLCICWTELNSIGVVIDPRGKIANDFMIHRYYLDANDDIRKINFIKYVAFLASPRNRTISIIYK